MGIHSFSKEFVAQYNQVDNFIKHHPLCGKAIIQAAFPSFDVVPILDQMLKQNSVILSDEGLFALNKNRQPGGAEKDTVIKIVDDNYKPLKLSKEELNSISITQRNTQQYCDKHKHLQGCEQEMPNIKSSLTSDEAFNLQYNQVYSYIKSHKECNKLDISSALTGIPFNDITRILDLMLRNSAIYKSHDASSLAEVYTVSTDKTQLYSDKHMQGGEQSVPNTKSSPTSDEAFNLQYNRVYSYIKGHDECNKDDIISALPDIPFSAIMLILDLMLRNNAVYRHHAPNDEVSYAANTGKTQLCCDKHKQLYHLNGMVVTLELSSSDVDLLEGIRNRFFERTNVDLNPKQVLKHAILIASMCNR